MIDVGAEGEASLLFCILWTTLPFSFEEKTSFNCECIQKGCRRATLKANRVKFKRLSYLASDPAQCDFGLWLVDKESLKEYPLISAGETVYKEDRVCLRPTSVYGCAWTSSYSVRASDIRVWVCKRRHMMWETVSWRKSRRDNMSVCVRVNERQGDESLGRVGQILTQEVTAVSCSLSQARHSPHACDIIHAYHTGVCMCTLDHTAYIILTIATVVLCVLFSFAFLW